MRFFGSFKLFHGETKSHHCPLLHYCVEIVAGETLKYIWRFYKDIKYF